MQRFTRAFFNISILGAVCVFASMTAAQAVTINITTEVGQAQETEFGFRDSTITRGVDLAGAEVTATFDDNTTETRTWLAFDRFTEGGVNGDRWSLFQQGDSNVSLVSDGRVLTSLLLDLSSSISVRDEFDPITGMNVEVVNGASLFDVTAANEDNGSTASTNGSSFGFPFSFTREDGEPNGTEPACDPAISSCVISVNYSGAVNITGAPAVGDLFTTLFVDFSGLNSGGFTGSLVYRSDQDTLRVAGDLTPVVPSPVPLPAGLPLLLAGLGGLAVLRRRKRS